MWMLPGEKDGEQGPGSGFELTCRRGPPPTGGKAPGIEPSEVFSQVSRFIGV